jgi:hypothetical protein
MGAILLKLRHISWAQGGVDTVVHTYVALKFGTNMDDILVLGSQTTCQGGAYDCQGGQQRMILMLGYTRYVYMSS